MTENTDSLCVLTSKAINKVFSLELANYSPGSIFMLVVADVDHVDKALHMMLHKLLVRNAVFEVIPEPLHCGIALFNDKQDQIATYTIVTVDQLEEASKGTTINDVLVLDDLLPLDRDIVNKLIPCIDSDSLEHSTFAKVVEEHDEQHNSET